jgi:hypothetical protein
MKKGNMLDEYINDSIGITDLTFIGNDNNMSNEEENYICEFCNVALIEKLDDKAHLGMSYCRKICPTCGFIYDSKKVGDINNIKHAESIHTLTSDSNSATVPFAECIGAKSDDLLETEEDPLDKFDSQEHEELRNQGQVISRIWTATRSSVTGRVVERFEE